MMMFLRSLVRQKPILSGVSIDSFAIFGAVQLLELFVQRLDSLLTLRIICVGKLVEYNQSCVERSTGGGICMVNNVTSGVEPCESGHTVFTTKWNWGRNSSFSYDNTISTNQRPKFVDWKSSRFSKTRINDT